MELYYRQYSSGGPPLVILHGLYGNHANWSAHARQLADDFAVYGFDARNHGQSPWADSMTLQDMADDVAQTLRALDLGPVAVVGHSMGGKTAMLLAQQQPALVRRLAVVDIAPVDYRKTRDDVLPALLELPLAQMANRAEADAWLATRVPEKGVRDFLLTNLQRDAEGGFSWRINLPVIARAFPEVAGWPDDSGVYEGPALFIRGEQSNYLLARDEAATRAQFPRAEIVTVKGAGHWVHSEKPAEVQQLLRDFLLV
ncbi:MAG TPA: alpha/beta fold hydrolase [Hyphomicrobiales bacterium]|nr:alpha/beta fold hydrolase [Hyphomicrobiales bacterium]